MDLSKEMGEICLFCAQTEDWFIPFRSDWVVDQSLVAPTSKNREKQAD